MPINPFFGNSYGSYGSPYGVPNFFLPWQRSTALGGGSTTFSPQGSASSTSVPEGYNPRALGQLLALAVRKRMQAAEEAPRPTVAAAPPPSGSYYTPDRNQGPKASSQLGAMQEPTWVKMVGQGPQGIPGYVNVPAGTPGAEFGGYVPTATSGVSAAPSSASFGASDKSPSEQWEEKRRKEEEEERRRQELMYAQTSMATWYPLTPAPPPTKS